MTRSADNPRAMLRDWKAEILRLTVFQVTGQPPFDRSGWWREIAGSDPESSITKSRTGECVESGPFGGGVLVLQTQPGRADWLLLESPGMDQLVAELSFPEAIDTFHRGLRSWLEARRNLARLALGAIVKLPVDDLEAGYRRISNFLPFDVDPVTSSDFMYQINRARPSIVMPDVRVNRLSKWSVGRLVRAEVSPTQIPVTVSVHEVPQSSSCRLELDINTSSDSPSPLPSARLPALFDEFVDWAREIIAEGDIP